MAARHHMESVMPRVSAFYGIVVAMFFNEERHIGRPHFHATYGGQDVSIDIETLAVRRR